MQPFYNLRPLSPIIIIFFAGVWHIIGKRTNGLTELVHVACTRGAFHSIWFCGLQQVQYLLFSYHTDLLGFRLQIYEKIREIWKDWIWINNNMMKKHNKEEYIAYLHQPVKCGIKLWDLAVWCKSITNVIQTLKSSHVANLRNICDKIIGNIQCMTLKNN